MSNAGPTPPGTSDVDEDYEFGDFLAWCDDRLMAGDDVSAGPLSQLTENLDQASVNSLVRFDAALRLLRAWRRLPGGKPSDDSPISDACGERIAAVPRETSHEAIVSTDNPQEFNSSDVPTGKIPVPANSETTVQIPSQRLNSRFRIDRLLGYGASGMVLQAYDPVLQRKVAIKVPQSLRGPGAGLRSEFLHEAIAIAQVEYPGIVQIHDLHLDTDSPFIVMAYCEGGSLAKWLNDHPGPRPPREAAQAVADLADALQRAHVRGVIHRDLKPGNILLSVDSGGIETGRVPGTGDPKASQGLLQFRLKIADFGLATWQAREDAGDEVRVGPIGTAPYMSPEQIEGRLNDIDARSDIYGLGVILYRLLTGCNPYAGSTVEELLPQVTAAPVPHCCDRNSRVPRDLDRIVQCCLAKNPAERYLSAAELAGALRSYLAGSPVNAIEPPGRLDRVWKWTVRRKAVVALGITLFVFLLAIFLATRDSGIEAEWRRTFGRLPKEIQYPGIEKAGPGGLSLDLQNAAYALSGSKTRFVELGSDYDGDFEVELEFQCASWSTDFGLFLGYEERAYDKDRLGSAQLIWLQVYPPPAAGSGFHLRRTLEHVSNLSANLVANDTGYLTKPSITDPVFDPTLKVVVRGGKVDEVSWSGKRFADLTGGQLDEQAASLGFGCRGTFGVFIRGGGHVWFKKPKFRRLPNRSGQSADLK